MKKYLLAAALSLASTCAFAGGADIYPEGFIQDCSYASVDASFNSKFLEFAGIDVDKEKASKEYTEMCSCLSKRFFSNADIKRNDPALAYEVYITMVQYNGRVNAPGRLRSLASRDISACKIEASKAKVDAGVKKFDKEHGKPRDDLQGRFMSDIRGQMGAKANEGYLRKADYLSKCMAGKVDEYTASEPDLKERVIERVRQNLKAGEFVNVPTNDNNMKVELIVLNVYDNCW